MSDITRAMLVGSMVTSLVWFVLLIIKMGNLRKP